MFAIAGGKGGCGKTTATLGIARALARRGRDPIAVDADLGMPDLCVLADLKPDGGLAAVAAGARPDRAATSPPGQPAVGILIGGDRDDLDAALARLSGRHGPVLVDCPAGAGPDAALPLRHADATILVTTATREALRDTEKTAAMARRLDAPPVCALVRDPAHGAQSGRSRIEPGDCLGCPVRERVPTVDGDPLTSRQFGRACEALAAHLDGARRRDRGVREG